MKDSITITMLRTGAETYALPTVDRYGGIELRGGPAHLAEVKLQFGSSQIPGWGEMRMPLAVALQLANDLAALQARVQTQLRRPPPDPPQRK